MNVHDFLHLVNERIAFPNCPLWTDVGAHLDQFSGAVVFWVRIVTNDRDTGTPGKEVRMGQFFSPTAIQSRPEPYWVALLLNQVKQMWVHELKEQMQVDGERRFDPHG